MSTQTDDTTEPDQYAEAKAHALAVLAKHGPSHLKPYLETWHLPGTGLRVAEVGWASEDHAFGVSHMQSDLPNGLAVCAQVERVIITHRHIGDPDEVALETERLEYLLRDYTRYVEGDKDPTPDGDWPMCQTPITSKSGHEYTCTWPQGHDHPQHVAADGHEVVAVSDR